MDSSSTSGTKRNWRGRTAMVTGASAGIGRAIARCLALELGMNVVAVARREARLTELAGAVADATDTDAGRGRVLPVPADLRDEGAILAAFDRADTVFGGVDVLINNAGLGKAAPLASGATDAWREMLEVNVLALCICTREAVSRMRRRNVDDGHVVHVSSMSAHRVPDGSGVYSATKFAVRALTEALRRELRDAGSHIRVSAVSPGFVETEFAENYHGSADAARETYSRFPVLSSKDVAAAVRYLLTAPPQVEVHDVLMRPTQQPT